jgi:SHS2 domain-containing protein
MPRPGYRIIPTTADIGIKAWGDSLPELFAQAARAVLDLITDTSAVRRDMTLELEVEGGDIEGLLVNWLNEIIFLHEARELVFAEAEVLEFTGLYIKGRLRGEAIDLRRHKLKHLIKGVTYHRLEISRLGERSFRLQVILDI